MELFKLLGIIAIENEAANKDIDETTDKAEQSEGKISAAFKKVGTAVGAYFAFDKIKDFGVACVNAAADANAAASQFSQVFGDMEGQAGGSLTRIADEAGISENRMKGSFTQIAAFAKTTGMDTEGALALTERAMVAVADSAAFYDRSLEDTTESLQSFLKGNYENDAALGLSCTEVTRNAAANELYGKSFNELSEAQKQLTLLQMVEDANKLSGAMGQASRESDTWTNQTGNLQQSWTDFTAEIGSKFLPVAVKVVGWIAEKMPEITVIVSNAMDKASEVIAAVGPVVKELFEGIKDLWNTVLKPVFTGIIDFITGVFTGDWQKAWQGISSILTGIWNGIWAVIKGILNSLIGGVESWINGAITSINKLISGLNKLVSAAGDFLGLDWNIREIGKVRLPRLEKGGILEKGQVGFLEGTGAEAVVPLDQNRAWIAKVANDMELSMGGKETVGILNKILEAISKTNDGLEEVKDSFTHMKFNINNREFARLVKAVD